VLLLFADRETSLVFYEHQHFLVPVFSPPDVLFSFCGTMVALCVPFSAYREPPFSFWPLLAVMGMFSFCQKRFVCHFGQPCGTPFSSFEDFSKARIFGPTLEFKLFADGCSLLPVIIFFFPLF